MFTYEDKTNNQNGIVKYVGTEAQKYAGQQASLGDGFSMSSLNANDFRSANYGLMIFDKQR